MAEETPVLTPAAEHELLLKPSPALALQVSTVRNEPKEVHLDVPCFSQNPELPTGCEATAVAMVLNYHGVEASKTQVANEMPYSMGNPDEGYVGNPYLYDGWTIYPPAFAQLVKRYLGSFSDLTGSDLLTVRAFLNQQKPIVCWVSMHGFFTHAIVLTGYNQDSVFYNDPWTGEKDATLSWDEFSILWGTQDYRALSS